MWRTVAAGLCLVAASVVWLIAALVDPTPHRPWSAALESARSARSARIVPQAVTAYPDRQQVADVAVVLGACAGFAGAAIGYRSFAATSRRSLPAVGLALLGVAASAWLVELALRLADTLRSGPPNGPVIGGMSGSLTVLAVLASGIGLALLGMAAARAGLVRPVVGTMVAVGASLGLLTGTTAVSYLAAAAPLGVGMLLTARRLALHNETSRKCGDSGPVCPGLP